ncbi:hypothetical protein [Chitinophaga qingshengii]|uniref:TonB C-terminal domain-containing protein n=1 Tax=Chitinophaga qingshengii TaxID=1569794 RepID=A0ABR7TXQ9_9BACT|nr:hypothetical protein [Chitinophaga qingshengii]MBC9933849.1 hypothetical protein [Chitinophaga qingshengii]
MRYSNGLYLSVPTPCGENWEKMTNTAAGKHCDSCAKTVIDFSYMTDAEIFAVINNSHREVCGRFQDHQLNRLIQPPASPRKTFLPALLLTAGLITGIANYSYAEARGFEKVEMALSSVPKDTVQQQPMKQYDLPEVQVTAYPRSIGKVVITCSVIKSSVQPKDATDDRLQSAGGSMLRRNMIDPIYPTDDERRQKKKKRWF